MDPNQDSPTPTRRPEGKKRSAAVWLAAGVLCVLLLGLMALFVIPARPEPPMVWLTPAQAQQANTPGPLDRARQLAKNGLAWLRHFYGSPPAGRIPLQFQIFSVSPQANLPALLGPPISTNTDGRQAWLLSTSDYAALKPSLRRTNGLTGIFSPNILAANGQQARMMMGNSVPTLPTGPIATSLGGALMPLMARAGFSIDVTPQSIPGAERLVRLPVTVSSTSFDSTATSNLMLRMNFFTASRALVHSGGALVIECPNADATNPTNYLMIVAPGYLDNSGMPLATPGAPVPGQKRGAP